MKKPGFFTRALISLFLTVPLIVIFLIGWKVAGLAFVPFSLFDWMSRLLPGPVITFSIESMVKTILFFNQGHTAASAKTAEQFIAVFIFLIMAVISGILILTISGRWKKFKFIPGIVSGMVLGLLILLIDLNLGRVIFINELWNLAVFILWSLVLLWIYDRIANPSAVHKDEKETINVSGIDRRRFLIRLGTASAAIAVTGAVVDLLMGKKEQQMPENERWSAHHELPNSSAELKPAPGTRPEYTQVEKHYRIDINATPPVINKDTWRLKITGLVENPREFTLEDIQGYEPLDQFITLACISNPVGGDLIGTTRWTGTSLQKIIADVRLKPSAKYLRINAADGFFESVSLDLVNSDKRIVLAYSWDGMPLTTDHGFPLRIYIPDRYGMKQPKWIESIEVMDEWEAGYWVTRGWDKEALMKATSVIDTIAVNDIITDSEGKKLIPVGGIAHAGARRISKVEVRIDNGPWLETKLRTPLSDLTWVIWRFDMPFQQGDHTLTVRCFDGNGTPQIITPASPHPSGASGLDSKNLKKSDVLTSSTT